MRSKRQRRDASISALSMDDYGMAPAAGNASKQASMGHHSTGPGWAWSDEGAGPEADGARERTAMAAPRAHSAESTVDPRLTVEQLLDEHGFSSKLLNKLYKDSDLMDAAFELEPFATPEDLFSALADKAVGARVAKRLPKKAGEHFDNALDSFPDLESSSEAFVGMRRTLMGMDMDQVRIAYELRFKHPLLDNSIADPSYEDNADWTRRKTKRVWDQLAVLPDADVAGNDRVDEMVADGGLWGFYSPDSDSVSIGMGLPPKQMAHTVRHEIGHAVHAQHASMIDLWLEHEIGYIEFDATAAGFRDWIDELGGFPSTFRGPAGRVQPYDTAVQDEIISALMGFTGSGSFHPTRAAVATPLSAQLTAAWQNMPRAVRNAATQVTSFWWHEYKSWPIGDRGGYYLNHWYGTPNCLSQTAYRIVKSTRQNYTAMSRYEFFANCYAEFFANKNGFLDQSKWGGRLPASVQDFFRNHLLDSMPYTPPASTESSTTE